MCSAGQCFAAFNHQHLSVCENFCQVDRTSWTTENFPERLLLLAGKLHPQWQPQTEVFAHVAGHHGASWS